MPFICGNAYLVKFQFTKPVPKEKFIICVCDKKPLFFFISSKPRTRFTLSSQLAVYPDDLYFLSKLSYINLAEVITCVEPHNCNIIKDLGSIPVNIKEQIKNIVRESETLPQRFIEIIISKI